MLMMEELRGAGKASWSLVKVDAFERKKSKDLCVSGCGIKFSPLFWQKNVVEVVKNPLAKDDDGRVERGWSQASDLKQGN